MNKLGITIEAGDEGFYLKVPISHIWHNFFANLTMEKESRASEIFYKNILPLDAFEVLLNLMNERAGNFK